MDKARAQDLLGRNPKANPNKIKEAFDLLEQCGCGGRTSYALSLPYTRTRDAGHVPVGRVPGRVGPVGRGHNLANDA